MSDLKFKMQEGGKVIGLSHNEGGIEVVDQEGTPVAEIEGEERIFSVEDTEQIEAMANEISVALDNDDQELADQTAMILGHRIVEMVAKQERINPS